MRKPQIPTVTPAELAEHDAIALWRAASSLSLADPKHLAANMKALTEARDYLAAAIMAGAEHNRKAA